MIHRRTSFMVTGAILVVATMTLYAVNVAKAQLAHIPGMSTKTITSGLGNMSKTIGKAMNRTIIPQAK